MARSLILTFMFLASASAKEIQLTPQTAASYALAHNLALTAARFRVEEARGRLHQSGRLANPELETELMRNTMGKEGSFAVGLMQRFPVTARLRHEKAVSRAELAAAEAEVRDAERKLAAEVSTAAVKLSALSEQRDLREKQLANSRELSNFLLKRVETGEAAAVDVSQVDLESRQIELENLQLAAEEAVLAGELRPLLGVQASDRVTIIGTLPSPSESPGVTAVSDRPDILAARARVEAMGSVVLEQRARRWEDVGFGGSYTRERMMDEPGPIETEQIAGFRFSLPLPIWNNNSGRIREAEAASIRAEKELEAAMLTAQDEVIAAHNALNAYAKLVGELDAKVLPAATLIEDQLRQNYSTGQTSLTEVLRARTRRLDLRRQRLDALRDYHLARIRYHAATASMPAAASSFK